MDADLLDVHLQTDLAGEDEQLARDILPGQVLSRIRFREPHLLRFAKQFAERHRAVVGVEQIAERARQDPFDLDDLVAAGDQIPAAST